MKSIWTGSIGFGLVNIPVKLYSASEKSELDFHLVDKKDHGVIHYQRVNAESGKEVKWENIVKTYKVGRELVEVTDEDFAQASPKKSRIIELNEFVSEEEIESVYYESPYYLEPEKSGDKAYALFRDALAKSKKAGLGSFVLRSKEHLCVLRPFEKVIVLNTMRYANEIRDSGEIKVPKAKSTPAEMKMAMALIDQLTAKFSIEKYKDTYSADLLKLIKLKAKGKKPEMPELKVTHRKTEDLMSQLKASLKKAS